MLAETQEFIAKNGESYNVAVSTVQPNGMLGFHVDDRSYIAANLFLVKFKISIWRADAVFDFKTTIVDSYILAHTLGDLFSVLQEESKSALDGQLAPGTIGKAWLHSIELVTSEVGLGNEVVQRILDQQPNV